MLSVWFIVKCNYISVKPYKLPPTPANISYSLLPTFNCILTFYFVGPVSMLHILHALSYFIPTISFGGKYLYYLSGK